LASTFVDAFPGHPNIRSKSSSNDRVLVPILDVLPTTDRSVHPDTSGPQGKSSLVNESTVKYPITSGLQTTPQSHRKQTAACGNDNLITAIQTESDMPDLPLAGVDIALSDEGLFCQTRSPYSFDEVEETKRVLQSSVRQLLTPFRCRTQNVHQSTSSFASTEFQSPCLSKSRGSQHSRSSGVVSRCSHSSASSVSSERPEVPHTNPDFLEYQSVHSLSAKIHQPIPICLWMKSIPTSKDLEASTSGLTSQTYLSQESRSTYVPKELMPIPSPTWNDTLVLCSETDPSFSSSLVEFEGLQTRQKKRLPAASKNRINTSNSSNLKYHEWKSEHFQAEEEKRKAFRARMDEIRKEYQAYLKSSRTIDVGVSGEAQHKIEMINPGGERDGSGRDRLYDESDVGYWTDDEYFFTGPKKKKNGGNIDINSQR
jgi:hypothetical protein